MNLGETWEQEGSDRDVKALETLDKDTDIEAERYLFSCDPIEQKIGENCCIYWRDGLKRVFDSA